MKVLAAVQGQLRGASSLAWNPVPIPPSLQTSDVSDVAICIYIDGLSSHIQYAALRYAPTDAEPAAVLVDQALLHAKCQGFMPKEVKWTRHVAEGSKHPLGVLSYSYAVTEDRDSVTRIAFYDAYIVIGSLAGQLIKQPNTQLPISCGNAHGYLGSMAVPGPANITAWQPDGRWTNTVVIGCSDGLLYFGDMAALTQTEPLTVTGAVNLAQGPVLSMSWHHQAMSKDILLVGSTTGFAVVHTRNQKILMAPSDTHKRRNVTGVCWLENGNSVAVTYNDEDTAVPPGVLQLWDLRRSTHPYKEIASHHQAGVLGLMRSNIDPRFFTSVSKDGRAVTWATFGSNAVAYSVLSLSSPATAFALLPCLGLASVLAGGNLYVLNLDANVVADALKFSPNWLLGNNALAFGFGGKLAYLHTRVNPASGQVETAAGICDLPCDDSFVEAVDVFMKFLANNDLAGYCHLRSREAASLGDPYEADIWSLLGASFLSPNERIPIILDVLGHNPADIQRHAQTYLGHAPGAGVLGSAGPSSGALAAPVSGTSGAMHNGVPEDSPTEHEAASFFDKLACTGTDLAESSGTLHNSNKTDALTAGAEIAGGARNGYIVDRDWSSGPLKLLKDLFLIGQPLGAIECAIQANDFGLAFMIACSLDNKMVLQTVKEKFVDFNKQSFVGVVAQSSEDNFDAIVNACVDPSEEWKEVAAILVTYPLMQEVSTMGTMNEFQRLCSTLAERLADDGDLMSAIPCFLVAGAYGQAAKLIANLPSTAGSQALKILVLRCLMNQANLQVDQDYQSAHTLHLFLTRLVNSGHIEEALSLLGLVGNDFPGTTHLRSLIEETRGSPAGSQYHAVYDIQPAPSYLAAQQQAQLQRHGQQQMQQQQMQPHQVQQSQLSNAIGQMPQNMRPQMPMPAAGRSQMPQMMGMPPVSMAAQPQQQQQQQMPAMIPGMPALPQRNQMTPQLSGVAPPMTSGHMAPPPMLNAGMPPPPPPHNMMMNPPPPPTAPNANMQQQQQPSVGLMPSLGMQAPGMPMVPPPPPAQMMSGSPPAPSPSYQQSPPTGFGGYQQRPQMPAAPPFPAAPVIPGPQSAQRAQPAMNATNQSMPPMPGVPPQMMRPQQSAFQMASNNGAPPSMEEWPKSTHPAAGVSHLQPGMPTPWPIPTPAQGGRTAASEKLNQQVQDAASPAGSVCPPGDLAKIKNALEQAISRVVDSTKQPALRAAMQELYKQLGDVTITQEVIAQLSQFADALNSQNFSMTMHFAHLMISTSWNKSSRNWLSAVKKLASPNTYAQGGPMQASF